MTIKNICILGGGTLGSRVALQAAISGYQVKVYDISQKSLDFSLGTMQKILKQLHKAGQISAGQVSARQVSLAQYSRAEISAP